MNATVTYTADEAPDGDLAKRTLRAMSKSGRFWLSARGVILFEVADDHFVGLAREAEIESAVRESGVVQFLGDPMPDDVWRALGRAVANRRWMLSPASNRPNRRAPVSPVRQ